jgi:hypothetical protein
MVMGNNESGDNKKCKQISCGFDCHADAAVQCGVHRPMEHIPGFTRSHWMPPSGKRQGRIAPVAAMVDEFVAKHKTLPKHNF